MFKQKEKKNYIYKKKYNTPFASIMRRCKISFDMCENNSNKMTSSAQTIPATRPSPGRLPGSENAGL